MVARTSFHFDVTQKKNKVGFADSVGEVDFVDIPEISKRYFLHNK